MSLPVLRRTFLDRLVGVFSPHAEAGRVQSRFRTETAVALSQRWHEDRPAIGYDAARPNKGGWITPGTSGNAEVRRGAVPLRNRARDLVRNNGYARKAKRIFVSSAVGTGIQPQAKTGNSRRDKKIMAAFAEWSRHCDVRGKLDFFGLQALAAGTFFESGSALVRLYDVGRQGPNDPGLRLQVMEPDYLDHTRGQLVSLNTSLGGIEIDDFGKPTGYWLYKRHPGDGIAVLVDRGLAELVPADRVCHIYRTFEERAGQVDGVSTYAAAIEALYDLKEWDDAERVRKKIEACFAIFVTQVEDGYQAPVGEIDEHPEENERTETIRPGMFEYLKPGQGVQFANPSATPGGDFRVSTLREISAGLGTTYEDLTGDLSQVNHSSYRGGRNQFQRSIGMDQWLMLIPMLCEPVWRAFIDRLYFAGVIDVQNYGVAWGTPKWESVNPLQDAQADSTEMRNGLETWDGKVRGRGYDPDAVCEEIANRNKAWTDAGIVLDADPRYTNAKGAQQPLDDTAGEPPPSAPAAPAKPGAVKVPAKPAPAK